MALLEIRDLALTMRSFEGTAHVLNGIDLSVEKGEIWGLVGETGSGKSLTGLSVNRLVPTPPGHYTAGSIRFDGAELMGRSEARMRPLRGREIAMIFQDPTTNLNPGFRISTQIIDVALAAARVDPGVLGLGPKASNMARRRAARAAAVALLDRVGIPDAARRIDDYPHQFSGGMRQRVLIAMALIGRPRLLIADEPTTALDVSAQAQILELIYELVQEFGLAVLFITHNLGVVARLCSHTAVLYGGTIVESGPTEEVLHSPGHPYTRGLIAAMPRMEGTRERLKTIPGNVPSFWSAPEGCPFVTRCDQAEALCRTTRPPVRQPVPGHRVACVRALDGAALVHPVNGAA